MKSALYAAAIAGTLFAPTEAQLRERDALVRWFGDPDCPGGIDFANNTRTGREGYQTYVVAVQGVCQRVPNAASYKGYRVNCGLTGGSGAIQYCQDTGCGDCPTIAPFQRGQCLPNDKELYGSASVSVLCPDEQGPTIPTPDTQELFKDEFLIRWFENPGCSNDAQNNNLGRTIVIGSQGICHRVPNAPGNAGYKVSCNSDGTGDITYCSDINCGSCSITAPFQGEVCLPNDAQRFGSASYTVTCPGPNARPPPGRSSNNNPPVVSQPRSEIVSSGAETYSMTMAAGALMATALYWVQ